MKMLIVVALLVAVAYVSADKTCGPLERVKVARQWAHAYGEGHHRVEFVISVWNNFFKAFPKARDLFTKHRGDNVYSPEFQAHGHRVLAALGMLIATADEPDTLKVMLGALKTRHAEIGIKAEFFEAFRHELMETLPEHVGNHFDWDAWTVCLNAVINAIKT